MDALNKFDPTRVERFEQYAEYRIRGAMLDFLRASDPLGRDTRGTANDHAEAVRALTARLGRPPTEDELLAELGLSPAQYEDRRLRFAQAATLSLDELMGENAPTTAEGDGDEQDAIAEVLDDLEQAGLVDRALRCLPPRHERVLRLHYFEELMLREIGKVMGFTESRACQLEAEGLLALRRILTDLQAGKDALHQPRPSAPTAPTTDDPLAQELAATAAALDALLDPVRSSDDPARRGKGS